jgi:hypothetical protein
MDAVIEFDYFNWKGHSSKRRVHPEKTWWGSTEWHPEPQLFLRGFDVGKSAMRDFATKDMSNIRFVD